MSNRTLAFSISKDSPGITWQYFRAGGPGGQKQNKTESGARVIHEPSGARGESREHASQWQNRKAAWKRMVDSPLFKGWLALQLSNGPTPEERVERDMRAENLKVEVKEDGKWVEKAI